MSLALRPGTPILNSDVAERFLHSGTARTAVPPVEMTSFWVAAEVENPNFGIQAYWKATFLHPTGVPWRTMFSAAVGRSHQLGGNAPSC